MKKITAIHASVLSVLVSLCSQPALSAQSAFQNDRGGSVGVVGGAIHSNFSADGVATLAGIRADHTLGSRILLGDLSVTRFRGDEGFGGARSYVLSEVQLQVQAPFRFIAPYAGAGLGWFHSYGGDPRGDRDNGAGSIAVGVRVHVAPVPLQLRVEGRTRVIGTYYSEVASEWTAGLAWRY